MCSYSILPPPACPASGPIKPSAPFYPAAKTQPGDAEQTPSSLTYYRSGSSWHRKELGTCQRVSMLNALNTVN